MFDVIKEILVSEKEFTKTDYKSCKKFWCFFYLELM